MYWSKYAGDSAGPVEADGRARAAPWGRTLARSAGFNLMPQISTQEFERLSLRVHDFLAGVRLHDVWAIDLPRTRAGITLHEFMRARGDAGPFKASTIVRALINFRLFVGRLLGWDREPTATAWESFATRLTSSDRSKSLVPAGTREGPFCVVYRFENEQLLELINRTAHAAALSALVETENAYRFYFGVYVCSVGRFTRIYMGLIDPFRKMVVYPSLLRSVRANWVQTFGPEGSGVARAKGS